MTKRTKRYLPILLVISILLISLYGCTSQNTQENLSADKSTTTLQVQTSKESKSKASSDYTTESPSENLSKNGTYTSKEDVALYIHLYGELPQNFITKKQAQELGWNGGSLEPYAPGKSIGGDYFGNYEGNLPKKKGRTYHECDIDTKGKRSRGAKRIVYSNDGLIYYTGNHYETFELLYGEE